MKELLVAAGSPRENRDFSVNLIGENSVENVVVVSQVRYV